MEAEADFAATTTPSDNQHSESKVIAKTTGTSAARQLGAVNDVNTSSGLTTPHHDPHYRQPHSTSSPTPPAAINHDLNAHHHSQTSTANRSTTPTIPTIVRTHTPTPKPRTATDPAMLATIRRLAGTNPNSSDVQSPSTIPSVDQFAFDKLLTTINPDITDAIDAIAEICAKSKLASADSYGAHLPPQGIIGAHGFAQHGRAGSGMGGRLGFGGGVYPGLMTLRDPRAREDALEAVVEASSSSERLAERGGLSASPKGKARSRASASQSRSRHDSDEEDNRTEVSATSRISIRLRVKEGRKAVQGEWTTRPGSPTVDVSVAEAEGREFRQGQSGAASPVAGTAASWIAWPKAAGPTEGSVRRDAKMALEGLRSSS